MRLLFDDEHRPIYRTNEFQEYRPPRVFVRESIQPPLPRNDLKPQPDHPDETIIRLESKWPELFAAPPVLSKLPEPVTAAAPKKRRASGSGSHHPTGKKRAKEIEAIINQVFEAEPGKAWFANELADKTGLKVPAITNVLTLSQAFEKRLLKRAVREAGKKTTYRRANQYWRRSQASDQWPTKPHGWWET